MKLGYNVKRRNKDNNTYIFGSKKLTLVTMATPIYSHVKDKNSIFTVRDEDMFFLVKGKILVFHQYLLIKLYMNQLYETETM